MQFSGEKTEGEQGELFHNNLRAGVGGHGYGDSGVKSVGEGVVQGKGKWQEGKERASIKTWQYQ